jgi:16S rRNA (cytosine967-C5)-methyltransferase
MMDAREIAMKALIRVEQDKGYSNLVLDASLSRIDLSGKDAALSTVLLYGVIENRIRLDYIISSYYNKKLEKLSPQILNILRLGVYQLIYLNKIPNYAVVDESVKLTRKIGQSSASGLVNAILRKTATNKDNLPEPSKQEDNTTWLSVMYSFPKSIVSLWIKSYGVHQTEMIMQEMHKRPINYARVNTLKTSQAELIEKLSANGYVAKPTQIENAIELEAHGSIEKIPQFNEGYFHIQDLACQICALALDLEPSLAVLDVCSAPGGKAFTIAQIMGDKGRIVACDIHPQRVDLIKSGAKRLGTQSIEAKVADATKFNSDFGLFDRVLCDVPCSGLGIIHKKPEIKYKLLSDLTELTAMQLKILENSSHYVKIGGKLIYSTCTLNPAENEQVTELFLSRIKNFSPSFLPQSVPFISENEWRLTLNPYTHKTDGFFIASFIRIGE